MAQKPDKFPDWATTEEIDEISGQSNFVEPPDFRKESGWTRREIPPRQWFNWLARKTGLWLRWIEDKIEGLQYASEAEALAGVAEDRVISPARFSDQSLTTNGYQVLPGGLILQWFQFDPGALTNNENFTVDYPIVFPNGALQVILSDTAGSVSGNETSEGAEVVSFNSSSVNCTSQWESRAIIRPPFRFFAIGY